LWRWGARTAYAFVFGPLYAAAALAAYLWLRKAANRRIPLTAAAADDPLVVMLVCTNLPVDPRVEREARALAGHGFRVRVICPQWSPVTPLPDWGPGVTFRILPRHAHRYSMFFPWIFSPSLYRAALAEPAWAYHAHDLDTALPALLAAAKRRVPCVCDFHEWYSENVSYDAILATYRPHRWYKRLLYRAVERLAVRSASRVVTVCDSIGKALEGRYQSPRKVAVIRNIPPITASDPHRPASDLRARLGIPAQQPVVLYQGGVGPSRNLEPVVRAMALVPDAALVIRGPGVEQSAPAYMRLAAAVGCADRVFCLPAVPSARVVAEARSADLGLWTLLADVGLNFKYALPNKVFEYLAAGLPLLAADLPEVRRLVEEYGIGLCFDPDKPRSIAGAVNRFVQDEGFLRDCRANIAGALDDLRADREWGKLADLYFQLAERPSCQSPLRTAV
jgi:glycosyltransferase involved in cell wall biosynthesis